MYGLYRKRKHAGETFRPGWLLGMLLILVFTLRVLIEFLKEPQVGFEQHMVLNMGQLLSIPFILAGIYLMTRKARVA
jgi:prolipoprotein diacylglyceryltransferase